MSSSAFVVVFLDDSHSDWAEIESQCHLICISFMPKNVENFFMYKLAICTYFEDFLFNLFAHLLIGLFVPLVFDFLELFIYSG
jgi:hypothetical protein